MQERRCESPRCGRTYKAKTRRSRFCSDVCRVQAGRVGGVEARGRGTVTALPGADGRSRLGRVETSIQDALEAADRLADPHGTLALALAHDLDRGGHTGTAAAALARGIQQALGLALAGVSPVESTIERIRLVHLQRASGA